MCMCEWEFIREDICKNSERVEQLFICSLLFFVVVAVVVVAIAV